MDSPENVFNFFPDVETDMEISSHRELTFRMELDRSLNFVVSGPFWLKFEPLGAFCEKFESATFRQNKLTAISLQKTRSVHRSLLVSILD